MQTQARSTRTVSSWVGRLLRFDLRVFDEISSDVSATRSALIIVVVASFLNGLGALLWWIIRDFTFGGDIDVFWRVVLLGGLLQVLVWLLWVYVVYQVLARCGVRVDFYQLIRAMGLAFAPMALAVLMVVTPLGVPLALFGLVVTVLFTNVAIQSVSRTESRHVLLANLSGFAIFVVVMGVLANIAQVEGTVGGLAPGIFFFNLA